MKKLLKGLNEQQNKAVKSTSEHILVIAGAGAGKTKVISKKVAYLLENRIGAGNIFCITFTRYAAKEMKQRIVKENKKYGKMVFVNTFHKLGMYLLQKYSSRKDFSIIREKEKEKLIDDIAKRYKISSKKLLDTIQNSLKGKDKEVKAANEYIFYLDRYKLMDIDLILYYTSKLLDDKEIQKKVNYEINYLIIDEYQDSNDIQIEIVDKINPDNLFVVGDDSQAIYGWNGSKVDYILNFENKYNAEVITLTQNYRSTNQIINAANSLISNNINQIRKTMTGSIDGKEIDISHFASIDEEMFKVLLLSAEAEKEEKKLGILCRTNKEIEEIGYKLKEMNIPYSSSLKISKDNYIKNLLRIIVNPSNDLLFKAVFNISKDIEIQSIRDNISIFESACNANIDKINEVKELIEYNKRYNALETLLMAEKLFKMTDPVLEANLRKWIELNANIGSNINLKEYLYYIDSIEGQEKLQESNSNVQLLTVHASKGLEYDIVIVPNAYEGNFPKKNEDIEEARRLFYVAVTRAKKEFHCFYSDEAIGYTGKVIKVKPSQFINEISIKASL